MAMDAGSINPFPSSIFCGSSLRFIQDLGLQEILVSIHAMVQPLTRSYSLSAMDNTHDLYPWILTYLMTLWLTQKYLCTTLLAVEL